MGNANHALRFLLDLAALAAVAYWGFHELGGVAQWLIGLGAPLLVAAVWGRYMSPKASHPVVDPVRLVIEVLVFGAGVTALFMADASVLGAIFAALALVHLALTCALRQRPAGDAAIVRPS